MLADTLSSMDGALAASLVVISLTIGYALCKQLIQHKLKKNGVKYPPYAPGSMLKHILLSTSSEYPWWILVSVIVSRKIFRCRGYMWHVACAQIYPPLDQTNQLSSLTYLSSHLLI